MAEVRLRARTRAPPIPPRHPGRDGRATAAGTPWCGRAARSTQRAPHEPVGSLRDRNWGSVAASPTPAPARRGTMPHPRGALLRSAGGVLRRTQAGGRGHGPAAPPARTARFPPVRHPGRAAVAWRLDVPRPGAVGTGRGPLAQCPGHGRVRLPGGHGPPARGRAAGPPPATRARNGARRPPREAGPLLPCRRTPARRTRAWARAPAAKREIRATSAADSLGSRRGPARGGPPAGPREPARTACRSARTSRV